MASALFYVPQVFLGDSTILTDKVMMEQYHFLKRSEVGWNDEINACRGEIAA
jgi:hypothetical protein